MELELNAGGNAGLKNNLVEILCDMRVSLGSACPSPNAQSKVAPKRTLTGTAHGIPDTVEERLDV
jgi:hypothetical protein